jgi:hypothetical protein
MHETAQNILSLFRRGDLELSTSQILEQINPEYAKLQNQAKVNPSIEIKRQLAQMHRKILHHLNKMVDSGILNIIKHGEKGEKFFSLNISEGEEIIEISPSYKKRLVLSRSPYPSMPIEGYEQKGIVAKYEPATWVDRLNSVVILTDKIREPAKLYKILTENIFPIVNDSICLENFESLIDSNDVADMLEKLNAESRDYGKIISISIELSAFKNKENFSKILELLSRNKLENLRFIFSLEYEDLEENFNLLKNIIELFSKIKLDMYIKNKKVQKSPYFIGRAGPYCFKDKEWQLAEELRKDILCLGCSQSSAIVDVNKFYSEHKLDMGKFSELMFNISKSMLSANSIQRRKSEDCFRSVNILNKGYEADFLILARNYIRFWNFGLNQPGMNPEFVLNMINEAKKKIDAFSAAEETIYKSCGMTTRFNLALAPAFHTAAKLSEAKYQHLEIKSLDDLHKKEIKKKFSEREALTKIFDGGDEITIHYTGIVDSEEIIRQIRTIISSYKIPLFNYNFANVKGDLKLTFFISGGKT